MTDKKSRQVLKREETRRVGKSVTAEHVAIIKETRGLVLSRGYNSIRVEVGIEMPWPCEPGKLESVAEGVKTVSKAVEARLDKKAERVDKLLNELSQE